MSTLKKPKNKSTRKRKRFAWRGSEEIRTSTRARSLSSSANINSTVETTKTQRRHLTAIRDTASMQQAIGRVKVILNQEARKVFRTYKDLVCEMDKEAANLKLQLV